MRKAQPFYLALILRFGLILALLFISLDLTFFIAGWDYYSLAGLAKFIFKALVFPMAVGLSFVNALLRKEGSATTMGILSHIILICILHTFVVSVYWYVFNGWLAPEHYLAVKSAYREGLLVNANQVQSLEDKTKFLGQADLIEKELKQFKSEPRDIQHLWLKPLFYMLTNYLVFALLFGSVFGFIFSKLRVAVDTQEPK